MSKLGKKKKKKRKEKKNYALWRKPQFKKFVWGGGPGNLFLRPP